MTADREVREQLRIDAGGTCLDSRLSHPVLVGSETSWGLAHGRRAAVFMEVCSVAVSKTGELHHLFPSGSEEV